MRKAIMLLLCLAMTLGIEAGQALELKQVLNGTFSARTLNKVQPLADGESYAQVSPDRKSIEKYSFKTGQKTGILFDANTAKGPKVLSIDNYIMSPDESRILIQTETESIYRRSLKAEYYIFTVKNNTLEPLSKNGKQQQPIFSPDGNQIAFARDNNLYLVKLLFNNSESPVTTDGKINEILNGIPDWVNEEEFATSRSFDFSADGKMLAWIKYDESKVRTFNMTMYKGAAPANTQYAEYPGQYSYKYPVAGSVNSTVAVYSYDIKSHVTRQMNVPLEAEGYIPRIQFTSQIDQLAVVTLNRHQSEMNLYMCNSRSGVSKLVLSEKDERYVKEEAYLQLTFEGNNFVLMSDRSGMRQLYYYTLTGQLVKQLTNGNFEVNTYYGRDPKTGTFYYQAYDGTATQTAIFSVNQKGVVKKLSEKTGSNSAIFSRNMLYYINTFSDLQTPPVTSICNNAGKTLNVLIDNNELKQHLAGVNMAQKELFTFKTSEGIELNGWMMKPANFSASKKYPVVMHQYSGPGSQSVRNAWGNGFVGGGLYESYLCEQGFIVACVDGRGTGGRGADFEKCTYLHLGVYEARDQVEAAIYLGNLPYVDKENIAIWGWSYGGFNTLMSMSEGRPVFKAGVAVAPPTDFRFYDTIYTERYMRTPAENPDGYDYNALNRVNDLHGALLLCHGIADDNVHFQNTTEYSEALVQADKQFEMQIYTNRNHSIFGGNTRYHLMTRITNFFISNLKN